MNKNIFALVILFVTFALAAPTQAQQLTQVGDTHYAKDANVGAADSLHYFGEAPFALTTNKFTFDSLWVLIVAEDTLNMRLLALAPRELGTYNIADSIGVSEGIVTSARGGVVKIAWWQLKAVFKDAALWSYRWYGMIHATGTAMAARGKRVRVYYLPFGLREI